MRHDYEIEEQIGEPVESYLKRLGDSYAELLDGASEVRGNTIYLSDYRARQCSLSEEFEEELDASGVLVYQRDVYENIPKIEFYSILNSLDKNEKLPEITEFASLARERENCESVYKMSGIEFSYYKDGKFVVDSRSLHHPIAEQFYNNWGNKSKYNEIAVIDTDVAPFE